MSAGPVSIRLMVSPGVFVNAEFMSSDGTIDGDLIPLQTVFGIEFVQSTIVLNAGQAAGTSPLVAANPSRKAIIFSAAVDFQVALTAAQAFGIRIYGSARDSMVGQECPTNALFLVPGSGLVAGNTVVVLEG